ncbi:LPXTG cell wall anchor domain-containing protein [Enterococcus asini]|uniref:LPXTG cell wall anchor domain-containing protein n=1 Tax=Enterococcus asini TaxID=57732 RepID=UPI0022E68AFF|nr:LPXTG cell wall anchor domain-containing protein [Enterococcus asini]
MTTGKKKLYLLALVALLVFPGVAFANETGDEYIESFRLELVSGKESEKTPQGTGDATKPSIKTPTATGTLPKTGEVVHFLSGLLGVLLVGTSGLLLWRRKKGGDAE